MWGEKNAVRFAEFGLELGADSLVGSGCFKPVFLTPVFDDRQAKENFVTLRVVSRHRILGFSVG